MEKLSCRFWQGKHIEVLMRTHVSALLVVVLILITAFMFPAGADMPFDIARDITATAQIRLSHRNTEVSLLTDGNYRTEWKDNSGAFAEFTLPDDLPCYTLYALTGGDPETLLVEAAVNGRWETVPVEGARFNIQCIPLYGLTHFRLRSSRGPLRLMEVRLFGPGTLPPDIVNFHTVADKADLLILACHPDDDILWLGGLMPTYAGQLGMKVQVAYMTSRFHYRRCEAMDALWHCGVRLGPVFLGLPDSGDVPYTDAVAQWGGSKATARVIARLIRQFRPEVLVTQDAKGEYGHVQHRAMVAACTQAVILAADPSENTLRDLPAWEVKKYYIHLYPEDTLVLNLDRPLSAFGGKTAVEIAQEAFALHKSQQVGRYTVAADGPYDIRRFGLAYSTVGPDEVHDGLFEHLDELYELEKTLK